MIVHVYRLGGDIRNPADYGCIAIENQDTCLNQGLSRPAKPGKRLS